jgi:tRNA 5-methylaminomethyl-2-thiouridine biosynthesis bifunctional protein
VTGDQEHASQGGYQRSRQPMQDSCLEYGRSHHQYQSNSAKHQQATVAVHAVTQCKGDQTDRNDHQQQEQVKQFIGEESHRHQGRHHHQYRQKQALRQAGSRDTDGQAIQRGTAFRLLIGFEHNGHGLQRIARSERYDITFSAGFHDASGHDTQTTCRNGRYNDPLFARACKTMTLTLPPIRPAQLEWTEDTPASAEYGDHYYSTGQGLEESELVFITANVLAERFAALDTDSLFVIGETGFGTGLNCLLAAQAFRQHAPRGARLHLVSTERYPLARDDLARALGHWPELGELPARLLEAYPPPTPGCHRLTLAPEIDLTLMLGDAHTLLNHFAMCADAWFLDGFAPARNEAMWRPELLKTIADRSRPGATLGTFTAAGHVRRALADAGFEVERKPGFGNKRHRVEGRLPGTWQPARMQRGHAIVAGAGVAGATTARALAERGWQVTVVDPVFGIAQQAPKHLAGVLYATASAHLHPQNRFYQSAFVHALRWLNRLRFPDDSQLGRLEGVVQHLPDQRIRDKTLAAINSGAWPEQLLRRLDEHSVCFEGAGYLQPVAWIGKLLDHPAIAPEAGRVESIATGSTALLQDGRSLECDAIILCTAGHTPKLPGLSWLPLRIVRGQVTFCRSTAASSRWSRPHCHSGYLTPAMGGIHCVGATFDRSRAEPVIDPADDRTNLAELESALPDHWARLGGKEIEIVGQHAGLRCQSADTLPLVGPMPIPSHNPHRLDSGVWLNIAHGSRGLTHTPLCADLIADQLSGQPPPVDTSIAEALHPERFVLRWRRRNPNWIPE